MNIIKLDAVPQGQDPKEWVLYNGQRCLLKREGKYKNSPYTEHLASVFATELGIPCHYTELIISEGTPAVLCHDLVPKEYTLRAYEDSTEASMSLDSRYGFHYSFREILSRLNRAETKSFWKMVVFDCLVTNTDRHGGNWGFLENTHTKSRMFSPLYDNANCFGDGRQFCSIRLEDSVGYPALVEYADLIQKIDYPEFFAMTDSVLHKDPVAVIKSLKSSVPADIHERAVQTVTNQSKLLKEAYDEWLTKMF